MLLGAVGEGIELITETERLGLPRMGLMYDHRSVKRTGRASLIMIHFVPLSINAISSF